MEQMNNLSRQQFVSKYGQVKATFDSYKHFSFWFRGVLADGGILQVEVGGTAEFVHRFQLYNNERRTVRELYPRVGMVHRHGVLIDHFNINHASYDDSRTGIGPGPETELE